MDLNDRRTATEHLIALGRELGVRLRWVEDWRDAVCHQKSAKVPVVRSVTDYLVGLHELGHRGQPYARRMHRAHDARVLVREAWAWVWAIEHALPRLMALTTERDWQELAECRPAYLDYVAVRAAARPLGAKSGASLDNLPQTG